MPSLRHHTTLGKPWQVLLLMPVLIVALLAVQWIGVVHRVVHSGLPFAGARTVASHTIAAPIQGLLSLEELLQDGHESLSHGCSAFDAAMLAYAIAPSPVVLPVVAMQFDISQRVAFLSWMAPFFPCFSSRAPPVR